MEVAGDLLYAIAAVIVQIIEIYIWVVIIAAVLSWVRPDPYNPIVQVLYRLTDPVYDWIRKLFKYKTVISNIDFSPIILIVFLQVVVLFLRRLIHQIG
ncbi:membrane protein [Campylobacterota bacterium]|nr:membrane protein [Campylobacterota bacterium]